MTREEKLDEIERGLQRGRAKTLQRIERARDMILAWRVQGEKMLRDLERKVATFDASIAGVARCRTGEVKREPVPVGTQIRQLERARRRQVRLMRREVGRPLPERWPDRELKIRRQEQHLGKLWAVEQHEIASAKRDHQIRHDALF